MRIIVEYFPEIDEVTQVFIRHSITPSMVSSDETSSQYNIDFCIEQLEEGNKKGVFTEDLELLHKLMQEGVEYIEI